MYPHERTSAVRLLKCKRLRKLNFERFKCVVYVQKDSKLIYLKSSYLCCNVQSSILIEHLRIELPQNKRICSWSPSKVDSITHGALFNEILKNFT